MNAELCNDAGELIGNPNVLVNIVSTRVRQLNNGDRPLLDAPLLGAADMALTELVDGKMDYELTDPVAVQIHTAKTRRNNGLPSEAFVTRRVTFWFFCDERRNPQKLQGAT